MFIFMGSLISRYFGMALHLASALAIITLQSSAEPNPAPTRGLAVAGHVAYLAAGGQGLIAVDISDPKFPRRIGRCETGGEAWAVAISGNYAYVANGTKGLTVVDISTAANLRIVGNLDTPGNVISVALNGHYAYLADNWIGMRIVDITDPIRPISVGLHPDEKINSVVVSGKFAHLSSNLNGIYSFDISDPENPREISAYGVFRAGFAKGLAIVGNRLYAALDHAGLAVFDVTDFGSLAWKGQCEVNGFASAVTVVGDRAYLSCGQAGFSIVDVLDPSSPRPIASYATPGSAFGIAIFENYALVADGWAGMQVFDLAEPRADAWKSVYHTGLEARAFTVVADKIYSAGASGLDISSIANNSDPLRLGSYQSANEIKDAAITGRFAFLAEGLSGVEVVEISNPANALQVGRIDTGGEANGLVASGNHLFVANGPRGLAVFDISDVLNIRKIGALPTAATVNGVTLDGTKALLASGKEGVVIVDISNPTAPRIVGKHDTSGDARAVAVFDKQGFVADGWAGVEMLDLTDATKPRRLGGFEGGGFALDVAVKNRAVFVADSFALRTLDFTEPAAPWVRAEQENVPATGVHIREGKVYALTQSGSITTLNSESPLLLTPSHSESGSAALQITGSPGAWVQVQVSTNLADWVDQQYIVLEQNGAHRADLLLPSSQQNRFYRAFASSPANAPAREIPQIILDSDIGGDGDDIGDVVLLHKLADMGLCNIVGMTFSVDIPYGAPALQAFNTYYGRPEIPVASTRNKWVWAYDCFDQFLVERFPNTMRHATNAQDSVRYYREVLAKAAPRSLIIFEASVIMSLYDLMLSGPDDISPLTGEELLNQKVKVMAVAAGDYPSGTEFYFKHMPVSSTYLVNRLKCPILFTGDSFGFYIRTGHLTQLQQLIPTDSIMRAAFEEYYRPTGARFREAWSQMLLWHLVVGQGPTGQKLFDVERGGYNFVDATGGNGWRSDKARSSQGYLVPVARESDIVATLTALMYLPPKALPLPYDPHVNLFAQLVESNGGSVSQATLVALDEYVKALKSDGTWDRKSIIWPCAGNDMKAALCLLKHPLLTSGVLRPIGKLPESFTESQGLAGNGQFALDTGIPPGFAAMRPDSSHLAVYSRVDVPGESVVDCGRYEAPDAVVELMLNYSVGYPNPIFDSGSVQIGRITAGQRYPTTGYFVGNRSQNSKSELFRNQTLIASGNTGGGQMPPSSLLIFSCHHLVTNSLRTLTHFSAGAHLTPSQLATDAAATEKLQRALGRSANSD